MREVERFAREYFNDQQLTDEMMGYCLAFADHVFRMGQRDIKDRIMEYIDHIQWEDDL
jgi:hypothetical protein